MSVFLPVQKAHVALVSSLEKVFPDQKNISELAVLEGFRGERLQFQVVVVLESYDHLAEVALAGPLARYAVIYQVGYVPCLQPCNPNDTDVLRSGPGMYPATLVKGNSMTLTGNCTSAFWISLELPDDVPAETSELRVAVTLHSRREDDATAELALPVHIWKHALPPQKLNCEMWFHGDCLMNYYKVPCWSPRYWKLLENYFTDMAKHGLDVLLTPLWTLALDIRPDLERPTVQLLEITKTGTRYTFGFRRLKRWISVARKAGIRKFSFSHLFTQWGLAATPKIMAKVDGEERRIFGWDVPSDSPEYASFLRQLFDALLPFLKRNGLTEQNVYFHLSDEPSASHIDKYESCSRLVHSMLKGYRTLDALSEVDFCARGVVDCPVVSETAIEPFMERDIPERWIYYCGEWQGGVPNRKLGMAPIRNRILGVLLYLYRMDGFLEWGYNFWFSQESVRQNLNPWNFQDIHAIFGNNGGAYVVFPGDDGQPVPTTYYEVFSDALQDLRALQLLESRIGREQVVALVQEGIEHPIKLTCWPHDPQWLLDLRRRIAQKLDE